MLAYGTHAEVAPRRGSDQTNRSNYMAASGARNVCLAIAAVSRAVRTTGDAPEQMSGAADKLSRLAEMLQSEVDRLPATIRIV